VLDDDDVSSAHADLPLELHHAPDLTEVLTGAWIGRR
jgi:hypothetical protein